MLAAAAVGVSKEDSGSGSLSFGTPDDSTELTPLNVPGSSNGCAFWSVLYFLFESVPGLPLGFSSS